MEKIKKIRILSILFCFITACGGGGGGGGEVNVEMVNSRALSCGDTDSFSQMLDENKGLLIDGEGDICIKASAACAIDIQASVIELKNCSQCISANEEGAEVSLSAIELNGGGKIICNSEEDAISAENNAQVNLIANNSIEVNSENGIGVDASAGAKIDLNTTNNNGTVLINGETLGIRSDDDEKTTVMVNSDNCELNGSDFSAAGENIDLSSCSENYKITKLVEKGPFNCEGTCILNYDENTTLRIDGKGLTCLNYSKITSGFITAGNLELKNCNSCISISNSSVNSQPYNINVGRMSCESTIHGLRFVRANITINAKENIEIKAERDGINFQINSNNLMMKSDKNIVINSGADGVKVNIGSDNNIILDGGENINILAVENSIYVRGQSNSVTVKTPNCDFKGDINIGVDNTYIPCEVEQ